MIIKSFTHSLNYVNGSFLNADYTITTDEQIIRLLGVTSIEPEESFCHLFRSQSPLHIGAAYPTSFAQELTFTPISTNTPVTFTCGAIFYDPLP